MKLFKLLFFTFSVIFLFSSCQKELEFESSTIAKGSLKNDAGGSCLPSSVNGIFEQGFTLNSSNFIDIVVDATATGSYKIESDTSNGYSFKGTGVITLPGLNNIRLIGSGTPVNAGTSTFIITFGSTTCRIAVTALAAGSTAVYTLSGDPGPCVNMIPSGVYTATVPMNSSNIVTVEADVTSTGAYSISTPIVNGVSFTGAGFFTSTGSGKVMTLVASGTPLVSGTFPYPITGRSTMCSFSITFLPVPVPAVYTIDCSAAVPAGVYTAGTPTTSANTVTISATPSTTGTYTITTTAVNGVTFSGSGLFTTTVAQPVILTASGTPTAAGAFNYPATASSGGSTCTFPITVIAAPPPGPDFIQASINGAPTTSFNSGIYVTFDNTSPSTLFEIGGVTASGDSIYISIDKPGPFVTGTPYTVNQIIQGIDVLVQYIKPTEYYFTSSIAASPTDPFELTFTNITPTRLQGTFKGSLEDYYGGPVIKAFTNGSFDVAY